MERIDQLRAEGELDSSGFFTMDAARARQVLARFSLEHPRQWLEHLVAAAVLARATRLEVGSSGGSLRIEFDGAVATAEEVPLLLDALVLDHFPDERRWLRWLALGVLGASREGAEVCVESSSGARVRLEPGKSPVVVPLRAVSPASTVVEVTYPSPFWRRLWSLLASDQETPALNVCRYAPLLLRVHGREISEQIHLDGLLPTFVQGRARLTAVSFSRDVHRREADTPYSVALCLRMKEPGLWVIVGGRAVQLSSRALYGYSAVIAYDELPTDVSGLRARQDALARAEESVVEEIERSLVDAAEAGDGNAWRQIDLHWYDFPLGSEVMSRPLLRSSDGTLHPLGTVRRSSSAFCASDCDLAGFEGRPVFAPTTLRKLGRRVRPTPLCLLPRYGWVREKVGKGVPRLPAQSYVRQSQFSYARCAGRCGLTTEPTDAMPVLSYDDDASEIEPRVALPAGLHVTIDRVVPDDFDFAPALVPLYQGLVKSRVPVELKIYHFIEWLDFITRQFQANDAGSPYEALLLREADPEHASVRFELQYSVEEFAHASILPGHFSPVEVRTRWDKVASLPAEQQRKLAAFLGK